MTAMALDPAGGGRDSAELALDTAAGTPNLSQPRARDGRRLHDGGNGCSVSPRRGPRDR